MQHFIRALLLLLIGGSAMGLTYYLQPEQEAFGPRGDPATVVERIDGPLLQAAEKAADQQGENPDPVSLRSGDGKVTGWKVAIPGNRPLATPAVVDGKVFIGGGFGSHEFYAFDARSGKQLWVYRTKDDGPTAAAVQDGYVAFNTESCELEIITVEGKPVWKKWLGDPLTSIPAVGDGKVYMAYPDSKGDGKYYLACFDLKTGKEYWKAPVASEIITTPVLADGHVYLATLEGTMYCFRQDAGQLVWSKKNNATSSPVVWKGECYFSQRKEERIALQGRYVMQQKEALGQTLNNWALTNNYAMQVFARPSRSADESTAIPGTAAPAKVDAFKAELRELRSTEQTADYLDVKKRVLASPIEAGNPKLDAGVGFAGGNQGSFKRTDAANIGQGTVAGVWAYQGSKPFIANGRMFSSMGDTVSCVNPARDKVIWKKTLKGKNSKEKEEVLDSVLTPPALVNGKVFLGTIHGQVVCLSAESGQLLWTVSVGEPVQFQPAVANGRVYVATSSGHLYCIETGDTRDDGWLMWGANAAHNGLSK